MSDFEKPRRLEPDTAAYLLSLGPAVEAAASDPAAEASLLVDNALDELRQRLASAACDRAAHRVVEGLAALAALPQALAMLTRLAPYAVFLATHRHSSHVLQTLLARVTHLMRAGESDDRLEEAVASFARTLLKELTSLAVDVSGSHVGKTSTPTGLYDGHSADLDLSPRRVRP